jgi:hypothetical protein
MSRVLDGQLLAIVQMQLKGPEWCSVAHFLDVEDFHARGCRRVCPGRIFNLHLGSAWTAEDENRRAATSR